MEFANAVNNEMNKTRTENNAVALKSTQNSLVDLFATVGAMRGKSESEIAEAFSNAFQEDKLLATKIMFYARNITGGLGERRTFRTMLKELAIKNPEIVIKNMENIAFFGRYDDYYSLIGTKAEDRMWSYLAWTIRTDMEKMAKGESISLCAKWLKSINASSPETTKLGKETARQFHMTHKEYRKMLSKMREYIKVTETKMSANKWATIKYETVPSHAMKTYRKAFQKHDPMGFAKFMEKVEKGEVTIKAKTLFPYDILMGANLQADYYYNHGFTINKDAVLEAQWKALPNYVSGENNLLVMADTSASMEGQPMATSIGLAIYFAERNKGAYKDLFLTFSRNPEFVKLKGATLAEKVGCIKSIVANTDLERAFDLILDVAISNSVKQEEMPKSLLIISDMHFDEATSGSNKVFFDEMKDKYTRNGYEMPVVVFWNVSQRGNAFQVKAHDKNVILVSGQSATTFKSIISNLGKTPWDFMVETLSDKIYDRVVI